VIKRIFYNKLVRDRIPQIIHEKGKSCSTVKAHDEEHDDLLKKKLFEETEEYVSSGEIEELADILEVIHGILRVRGVSFDELEMIRKNKARKRGAFEKGIVLVDVSSEERIASEEQ
jgi:predicted house-cleaning noncanonical NTP pyrophosphatase (MazG superfamily)